MAVVLIADAAGLDQVDLSAEQRLELRFELKVSVEPTNWHRVIELNQEIHIRSFWIERVGCCRAEDIQPPNIELLAECLDRILIVNNEMLYCFIILV